MTNEFEDKFLKWGIYISKFGAVGITIIATVISEILYILMAISFEVPIAPFGVILAFMVPIFTAYPTLYLMFLFIDIIKKQGEELERNNGLKNTLLSVVSHDVKGPLMNTDLVLDMYFNKDIDLKQLNTMLIGLHQEVKSNLDFVMSILQWTKTQFDGFEVAKEEVDLLNLFQKVIDAYNFQLEQKNLTIDLQVAGTVFIDKDLMRMILRNLLSNAIKYSEENGTVKIEAHIENGELITEIADDGIGMSKEKLKSIFEDQMLYSSKGTYLETGTGLGLKLCKTFVKKHGGNIWAESKEGKGSSFYFSLPQ